MKSSIHITNDGNTIRAKGAAAQALFDALTKKPDEPTKVAIGPSPEDYMAKYTLSKPCCVDGSPDAHTVWLRVEGQLFCVTSIACDTLEEAEWMRLMLAKALLRIVELEK